MQVVSQDQYASALDTSGWIQHEQNDHHKAMSSRYSQALPVSREDEAFFRELPGVARLLVISEECGADCEVAGVLDRLTGVAGEKLEVRFVTKRENPELMQRYLKEGKYESVPVIIALDKDNNDVGVLYEMPQELDDYVQSSRRAYFRELGLSEDISLGDLPEEQQSVWVARYRDWRKDNGERVGRLFIDEVKRLAAASLGMEPVPVRKAGLMNA
jgi:hypothetical protein